MSGTRAAALPGTADVVLGVDLGTTGVKVAAFVPGAGILLVRSREYPLTEPRPGYQEQDPRALVRALLTTVRDVVGELGGRRVLGLGLSTAMHGLLGLGADGSFATPVITWADSRASEVAVQLRRSGASRELHALTGVPLHPMTPLVKLLWLREHDPTTWRRVSTWVGLKELCVQALTGMVVGETSSASGSALLDVRAGAWADATLELTGLTSARLPELRAATDSLPLSEAAGRATGLPVGTPVVLGAADGPLGNLGTGATGPGQVGLSVGTSAAARMMVTAVPDDLDPALFCYLLVPGLWALGGASSSGGGVVRWASGVLDQAGDAEVDLDDDALGARDDRLLDEAGSVPPGSDGLVMVPFVLPERGLLWDPEQAGAWLGLRRRHRRAHLVRAAVEGVSLQLAAIVDRIDGTAPVTEVRATGGALRHPLWRVALAGALGREVHVVGPAAGTASGAAAVALFALGGSADLLSAPGRLAGPADGATPETVVVPEPGAVAGARSSREALRTHAGRLTELVAALGADGAPPAQGGDR